MPYVLYFKNTYYFKNNITPLINTLLILVFIVNLFLYLEIFINNYFVCKIIFINISCMLEVNSCLKGYLKGNHKISLVIR